MIKLSKVRDLTLIVLALLFLPQESRILLFHSQPEDWYGEMLLPSDQNIYIIAKNSSPDIIKIEISGVTSHIFRHIDSGEVHSSRVGPDIAPHSYSLITADPKKFNIFKRSAKSSKGYTFSPGPLTVSTRADAYMTFILAAILICVFSVLAFTCAVHILEKDNLIQGID